MKKNKFFFILILIILIGGFFRFYKLDWGNGLFTHPDEYHIVTSVNQLTFPTHMHPNFFSYGTVIIYLIYFTKEFFSIITNHSFIINIFLIGRFYSAFFSTITIIIVYAISRFFLNKPFSCMAAFLVAITPGLIQQAHFTTPESNLIFFIFTSLLFLLYFLQYKKIKYILIASVFLGFALGVKVSSIVFLLPLIVAIISCHPEIVSGPHFLRFRIKSGMTILGLVITSTITIVGTLAIVAPFIFLDFSAFKSNLDYEGHLAAGKFSVFYTRQFINTVPILFQIEKIYPYALGIPFLITGLVGFFFSLLHFKDKKYFILIISFLSIFIPNAFLFAKWTRFISPTFPFFAIFSTFILWEMHKKWKSISYALIFIIIFVTSLWTYAFFSIYKNPDVRITASNWLISNIPSNSTILVEGANMIDVPLSGNYKKISLDFYHLEDDYFARKKVIDGLFESDYFIIQSRRVFLNHQQARKQFPKTAHFYDMLFAGELGFEQIKKFNSYPRLSLGKLSIEFPDENAEETWSVFDHPVIRVFKKKQVFTNQQYENIFEK